MEFRQLVDVGVGKSIDVRERCGVLDDSDMVSMFENDIWREVRKLGSGTEVDLVPDYRDEVVGPGLGDERTGDSILVSDELAEVDYELREVEGVSGWRSRSHIVGGEEIM